MSTIQSPRLELTAAMSIAWPRGRACPHVARAETRDARPAAVARAEAALAEGGDRAPGRNAGAVAAGAVRRHLDAHDELPARGARARARARRRPQGHRDAADAAPRHAARLRAPSGRDERDELPVGECGGEGARPVGAHSRGRGPGIHGRGARIWSASTDSAGYRSAGRGGAPVSALTFSTTTRLRSGGRAPRRGSSRWTSPRRTTPPRPAPRCLVATSRRSGPRRGGTSAPGA